MIIPPYQRVLLACICCAFTWRAQVHHNSRSTIKGIVDLDGCRDSASGVDGGDESRGEGTEEGVYGDIGGVGEFEYKRTNVCSM